MAKMIRPNELAEIVAGLLVRPDLMGELESPEQHADFMGAIGQVVCDFCGGDTNGVDPADSGPDGVRPYLDTPYLSVHPNDSLPSLGECVWAPYDPDGWEDETDEEYGLSPSGTMTSVAELDLLRSRVQALLIEAHAVQKSDPLS